MKTDDKKFIDTTPAIIDRALSRADYDNDAAMREGWCVSEVDNGANVQIQKLDTSRQFDSDYRVWEHVVTRAREGSKCCTWPRSVW